MSKQYFAKLLAIEGEIKGIREMFDKNSSSHKAGLDYLDAIEDKKLFLCSRYIQVGDKDVYIGITKLDELVSEDECNYLKTKDTYKVIGEISPNAIWVKEGDLFDEKQIKTYCMYGMSCLSKGAYDKRHLCKIGVKIKSSQCNTFH